MDKYDLLQQIGDGTFGSVAKAVHKKTGQLVAIKRMKQKYYSWDECVNLPEVQVLRKLQSHPNVIKLREVVRENNELFFVFEFMDGDLLGVIRKYKQNLQPSAMLTSSAVPYPKIKAYMFQVLQALSFLHKSGYFHRDMKPENLLIRKDPQQSHEIVKLADFGLVKEVRARPPYTDYVSTRWYRAPELLLQDRAYSCAVDVWAAGCIFAELITTKPLFPGNNEVDQLFKIMSVFGTPTEAIWPEGLQLARKIRYQFPLIAGTPLRAVLPPHVPAAALDLMSKMLVYDPKKRITCQQALTHPYFNVGLDEEPLAGYAVPRTHGSQSAPNPQVQQQTPVQWRQPDKEAVSANKVSSSGLTSSPIPNTTRPASGNRPIFPPVEISKHNITAPQDQSSLLPNSNSMSKYYLVPTGYSPKQKEGNVPIASSGQITSKLPSIDSSPPPPPIRPPTKVEPQNAIPAAPLNNSGKASKAKLAGSVDLDMLMDEFQNEMAAMGFSTKKEAPSPNGNVVAPGGRSALSLLPVARPPPGPTNATIGGKGLPLPQPARQSPDPSSPLQKLLSNSRYRPSQQVSALNSPHVATTPTNYQQQSAGPSSSGLPPVPMNPNTLTTHQAVTAANRYDLDSSSFASLDIGVGGPRKVTGNAAVSPSVQALLSKYPIGKPAPITTDDDDLPAWLKLVNDRTKRTTPDFSKGAPLR